MTDAAWVAPLVQGVLALLAAGALFVGARLRFHGRRDAGAGTDVGLD
ncbi:hypothetical protein [Nocardioides aurantiacus]